MENRKLIIVEGNIAAGKSTLCKDLATILNYGLFIEPTDSNPYLEKYYKEDLVIRPYMSGLYYLTDKNSGLPVMTPDGDYVIISQMDFVDAEGSVQSAIQNKEDIMETIMKQNKNNKILQLSESLKINKMVNNK